MNLYVANLANDATDQDLRELFGAFGELVSVSVIMDKMTGSSRGFGFVEFKNKADGEKAIAEANGAQLKGKSITVNEARPREDRPRGGGYGGGGGGRGGYGGGRGGYGGGGGGYGGGGGGRGGRSGGGGGYGGGGGRGGRGGGGRG